MRFKNIEIYNVCELYPGEIPGSVRWLRVPQTVYDALDTDFARERAKNSIGVELRFVMHSESVKLRMRTLHGGGTFHVYRGSIQGGWEDTEQNKCVGTEVTDFEIKRSENLDTLRRMRNDFDFPFAPEVVRVIFDRGTYELVDIIGEVEPPRREQLPNETVFAYGSSITHGSNSIDLSHSWLAVLAHNLRRDARNLGMAGSCCMEKEFADFIAEEGKRNQWQTAILSLGINVLDWEEEKFRKRARYMIETVARNNPEKKIYVITPLYCMDDYYAQGRAAKRRETLEQVTAELNFSNVRLIGGLDLLGDMSLISADEIHPNIYGVAQIAERLEKMMRAE